MQRAVTFLLLVAIGCASASSSRPAGVAQPEIDAVVPHSVFFGSAGRAAVNVSVLIRNRATVPITVRRVEVSSPGMAQYRLIPSSRDVKEEIKPGETTEIVVFAQAVTEVAQQTEPLTMRVIADFEANGTRWREIAMGL